MRSIGFDTSNRRNGGVPLVWPLPPLAALVRLLHNAERAHVVDGEHGVLAAEPDVGKRPARAFLGGALASARGRRPTGARSCRRGAVRSSV